MLSRPARPAAAALRSALRRTRLACSAASTPSHGPPRPAAAAAPRRRHFHFASTSYDGCFGGGADGPAHVPTIDGAELRRRAVARLRAHEADPSAWYDDPVATVVAGQTLGGGAATPTTDAFGRENGRIALATEDEYQAVAAHLRGLAYAAAGDAGFVDLRPAVRDTIERKMFEMDSAAELVALQAAEFFKQDGVTEIEESVEANDVERRMNDLLFDAESAGQVVVGRDRAPVFVGCVSNFSNFLDLSRKVLRHLELGIPVVVLSRSNTTQHMYRWFQQILAVNAAHGKPVDEGLLTYAAFSMEQTQRLFDEFPHGPMHITTSREVAASVRDCHPNVLSSTGGPNTLVSTEATPEVMQAIRWSAAIENSGQCTALRHAVVSGVGEADVVDMFEGGRAIQSSAESLETSEFANLFDGHPRDPLETGYSAVRAAAHGQECAYRVSSELPPDGLDEHWRQVYVDVTSPDAPVGTDPAYVSEVARWLVRNQPISLAVNGSYPLARQLFEETGQVVYSVGDTTGDFTALTCQARPQDGEIFGEFPPRKELFKFTKFPMVIPSPVAGYNATYSNAYLRDQAGAASGAGFDAATQALADAVASQEVRGFLVELNEYLADAAGDGPREGWRNGQAGQRTTLYGLQRPPLNGQRTVLRAGAASVDDLAPYLLPFSATTAAGQARVSVSPNNREAIACLEEMCGPGGLADLGFGFDVETDAEFAEREQADSDGWYNVVRVQPIGEALASPNGAEGVADHFPMVGQWISLWFPLGHIKSTKSDDQPFLEMFRASDKWLRKRF